MLAFNSSIDNWAYRLLATGRVNKCLGHNASKTTKTLYNRAPDILHFLLQEIINLRNVTLLYHERNLL